MGRTSMPFGHVLESERGGWNEFRKRLSEEDREALERLFDKTKFPAHMFHPHPMGTILLSIILETIKSSGVLWEARRRRTGKILRQEPYSACR